MIWFTFHSKMEAVNLSGPHNSLDRTARQVPSVKLKPHLRLLPAQNKLSN